MTKTNKKINDRRKAMERWYNITSKLSEFETLINKYDGAAPAEILAMKTIHAKLYECFALAKEQLNNSNIRIG